MSDRHECFGHFTPANMVRRDCITCTELSLCQKTSSDPVKYLRWGEWPPHVKPAPARGEDMQWSPNLIAKMTEQPQASDGSTASYYELPEGAKELQDLISAFNMNAQMGEIGRAWYRYGRCPHSPKKRELKKIIFYAQAELDRLEKYGEGN